MQASRARAARRLPQARVPLEARALEERPRTERAPDTCRAAAAPTVLQAPVLQRGQRRARRRQTGTRGRCAWTPSPRALGGEFRRISGRRAAARSRMASDVPRSPRPSPRSNRASRSAPRRDETRGARPGTWRSIPALAAGGGDHSGCFIGCDARARARFYPSAATAARGLAAAPAAARKQRELRGRTRRCSARVQDGRCFTATPARALGPAPREARWPGECPASRSGTGHSRPWPSRRRRATRHTRSAWRCRGCRR